jgi:hypothetical protein
MELQCEVIHFGSQSKEALSVLRGTVLLLALESSEVIGLRIAKLARGGADAQREAHLTVTISLISGAAVTNVIKRFRELVAANTEHFSATERYRFLRPPLPRTVSVRVLL